MCVRECGGGCGCVCVCGGGRVGEFDVICVGVAGGKAWLGEQVRPGENKVVMDGGLCVNLIPYEACESL